eukprot:1703561-Pyramimonas_sp.AAC.1
MKTPGRSANHLEQLEDDVATAELETFLIAFVEQDDAATCLQVGHISVFFGSSCANNGKGALTCLQPQLAPNISPQTTPKGRKGESGGRKWGTGHR